MSIIFAPSRCIHLEAWGGIDIYKLLGTPIIRHIMAMGAAGGGLLKTWTELWYRT